MQMSINSIWMWRHQIIIQCMSLFGFSTYTSKTFHLEVTLLRLCTFTRTGWLTHLVHLRIHAITQSANHLAAQQSMKSYRYRSDNVHINHQSSQARCSESSGAATKHNSSDVCWQLFGASSPPSCSYLLVVNAYVQLPLTTWACPMNKPTPCVHAKHWLQQQMVGSEFNVSSMNPWTQPALF